MEALARWLTEQGIRTPRGSSRWDSSYVSRLLRNSAYCGRAGFGKTVCTDGLPRRTRTVRLRGEKFSRRPRSVRQPPEQWIEIAVPSIVSSETFELAAARMRHNEHFSRRRTLVPSLLQGLVVCEGCGYSFYRTSAPGKPRKTGKLYYYRCRGTDNHRLEGGRVCDNRPIRQEELDALVWQQVVALLSDPEVIGRELERRLAQIRSTNPTEMQKSKLEIEIKRVHTATERLVEAYQEGLLALEELRQRMPVLRQRESSLRSQLTALDAELYDQETTLKLAETLNGFLARLKAATQEASIQERQRVVRLLVKEVLLSPERVVVRHSIPSQNQGPGAGYVLHDRLHRRV